MKSKSGKCIGCGNRANDGNVCSSCSKNTEIRQALEVRISSDYSLSKNDWLINALSFVHACGALPEFIDKVESNVAEIMMAPFDGLKVNPLSLLGNEALLSQDEKKLYGTERNRF